MSGEQWIEGLSRTSIGRFGGLTERLIPYNSGYLTANATATRLYLTDRKGTEELGCYQLPRDFRQETRTDWTGNRYRFTAADGRPHSTVTRSLLFPGFHHAIHTGRFEYYWRIQGYGATELVLPLADGVRVVDATDGYDPARDGKLGKPWVLFAFAGSAMPFDYPMMFTFDKRPARIEVRTQEYLSIDFAGPDAVVVQIHPFGARRLDKAVTAAWRGGFPAAEEARMDLWSAAALAYPVGCREHFRIDERRGVLEVRNDFEYAESDSDWPVEPLHLAPLPPVLASARRCLPAGEVAVRGRILPELCPTCVGWYEAVEGTRLEYEIPLSRFRNHTLAPVRIGSSGLADDLTSRLTEYLTAGDYLTFGGDEDYDPQCSLDCLHDLRTMAWAVWSIPDGARPRALEQLTRGLGDLAEEDFLEFAAPFTSTAWARHKSFFRYRGVVDYDCEWYNGMNLAGLWAYDYFTPGGDSLELIRRRWPLVRKLFGYYQAFSDWAIQTVWTSARGELVWLDGVNYAYEGLLAFAALARKIGADDDARWGDYLAARSELFIRTCWNSAEYMRQLFGTRAAEATVASGYYECRPTGCGDNAGFSCGNYGYAVREVLLLLKDMDKQGPISRELERFGRNYPRWRSAPYEAAPESQVIGYHGRLDPRRPIHHYFLDPRLMVSALVLDEDVAGLAEVGATLTAPVLECFLVALAPRVLVPRDVEFLGSTWDAARKALTVKLSGRGVARVGLAHCPPAKACSPAPLETEQAQGRVFYTFRLDGEAEIVLEF